MIGLTLGPIETAQWSDQSKKKKKKGGRRQQQQRVCWLRIFVDLGLRVLP